MQWTPEVITEGQSPGRRSDGTADHGMNDPVSTIVLHTGPSDGDAVILDGEIVKAAGVLTGRCVDNAGSWLWPQTNA
jgi:hypothetical protein